MRHFIIFLAILALTGCSQIKDFASSFDIIEQNQGIIERYGQAKQDIEEIQEQIEPEIEFSTNDAKDGNSGNLESEEIDDVRYGAGEDTHTSGSVVIPATFDLPVKFVPQAPFAVWDELHKEACEEAAMIMAVRYLKGEELDKQIMEEEILALVKWEEENGYKIDVTANETMQILKDYFGLQSEVNSEVTVERIKRELALGNLVITPHAGRQLGNPYYRQPGPVYHFLVIRGWTKSEFITNDVGTKRGDGYKYKFDKLISTVHDWNGGEVEDGERVMIIVYR